MIRQKKYCIFIERYIIIYKKGKANTMTLGDLIKEYAKQNSMQKFLEDSGISKAYVYMLINNRNSLGEPIVPSIPTIKKAAKGMHCNIDDIFYQLDDSYTIKVNSKQKQKPVLLIPEYSPATKKLISLTRKCTEEEIETTIIFLKQLRKQHKKGK